MIAADEQYLLRAIRLAMNGRGSVEPNPMVGCVLVKDDRVIGEAFHQQYGHPHAEPNALASCTESPEGATAYVTLEPCCHTNKQTPPCVPRLIAAKIARVVIGCFDPNPQVNGKGVQQLRDAGIIVEGSSVEAECKQLIAPFISRTVLGRPYITMKWAQSADGKVAGANGKRMQISNQSSSEQVQWLRSRSDAILVGINTVLNDDPTLLPREVPIRQGYHRMVLDRRGRLPRESMIVRTVSELCPVTVYSDAPPRADLLAAGITFLPADAWLSDRSASHLLIEPGPTLAKALLPRSDRLWVIHSPKIVGDEPAPSAAHIPHSFVQTGEINLDGDVLREYLNTNGDVFVAAVESADLTLMRTQLSLKAQANQPAIDRR